MTLRFFIHLQKLFILRLQKPEAKATRQAMLKHKLSGQLRKATRNCKRGFSRLPRLRRWKMPKKSKWQELTEIFEKMRNSKQRSKKETVCNLNSSFFLTSLTKHVSC